MVNLYTSLGELVIGKKAKGSYPSIKIANKQHFMDIPELILWTKGNFNFCTHMELETAFKHEEKTLGEMNFSFIKSRLLSRGLMVCGTGDNDAEALWNLISDLHICKNKNNSNIGVRNILFLFQEKSKDITISAEEKYIINQIKRTPLRAADILESSVWGKEELSSILKIMYYKKLIIFTEICH